MVNQKYPSQMSKQIDAKTGKEVTKLTNKGISMHLYFTENSFSADEKSIYYLWDKGEERCFFNIFKMDLETGEITQLTDEPEGINGNAATKTPDDTYMAYITGNQIKLLDLKTLETKLLHTEETYVINQVNINSDKTLVGFTRNELVHDRARDGGANYSGFYERYVECKDGRITTVNIETLEVKDAFLDTCLLGHFQFSPDDPEIAMFCHEGPWNYVTQRIWILNTTTGKVLPCFRQGADDCVGHEFWMQDGNLLFDNRRAGHDGTISSEKTQVVIAIQEDAPHQTPYFGIANKKGEVIKTFDMPYYCNHYHANKDGTIFVGDAVEDIVLIRPNETEDKRFEVQATHNTTWKYQWTHCHPTFSWSGDKILYEAAIDEDTGNLFLLKGIV